MRASAQPFWEKFDQLWDANSEKEKRRVAHSVLLNFRKRLPPLDASRITDLLPSEIASLSAQPRIAIEEDYGHRPVLDIDASQFISRVSEEANVPPETAHKATIAVFQAIRSMLPDEEIDHVRRILPLGLKEIWGEKVKKSE
ncbi:hypothetical protein CHISP_3158 [Chitinispirillum alkaliphilum]|nr:hypothetical protein CHISP_3158 [Chitinispirillum alkaliphilum]